MAPYFDRVVTNLSTETSARNAIEWEENAGSVNGDGKRGSNRGRKPTLRKISVEDDEYINLLLEKEDRSLKEIRSYVDNYQGDATEMRLRTQVINWILNVHAYFGFCSQTAFLSVTYFDRFLSKHTNPRGSTWLRQLVAVGSISLAAKIREPDAPLLLDLQVGDIEHIFESRTIQRMELLIMSTLNWKMGYVTPFSYLHYLLQKVGFCDGMFEALIERSEKLILYSCRDFRYLSYSPSAVALVSLVRACREEAPLQAARLQCALYSIWPLKEKEALEWAHLMDQLLQQDSFRELQSVKTALQKSLVPLSPMAVLDAACFSSDSCDQTMNTHSATAWASMSENDTAPERDISKRKELNELTYSLPPQIPRKKKNL